jgi:molybdopterin synthase sulfur carrier subunit
MTTTAVSTITVRVLLFASYAEALGLDSVEICFQQPTTIRDVLVRLRSLPGGERLPPKPLLAVNLAHVHPDTMLSHGDELAILPPLAGG